MIKHLIIRLLASIFLLSHFFSCRHFSHQEQVIFLENAVYAFNNYEIEEALMKFERVETSFLANFKGDTISSVLFNLARIYSLRNNTTKARHYFEQALVHQPDTQTSTFFNNLIHYQIFNLKFLNEYPFEKIDSLRALARNDLSREFAVDVLELKAKIRFDLYIADNLSEKRVPDIRNLDADLAYTFIRCQIHNHLNHYEFMLALEKINHLKTSEIFQSKRFQLIIPIEEIIFYTNQYNTHQSDSIIELFHRDYFHKLGEEDKLNFLEAEFKSCISKKHESRSREIIELLKHEYYSQDRIIDAYHLDLCYSELLQDIGQYQLLKERQLLLENQAEQLEYSLGSYQAKSLKARFLGIEGDFDGSIAMIDSLIAAINQSPYLYRKHYLQLIFLNQLIDAEKTSEAKSYLDELMKDDLLLSSDFFRYQLSSSKAKIFYKEKDYESAYAEYSRILASAYRENYLKGIGLLNINLGILAYNLSGIEALAERIEKADSIVKLTEDYLSMSSGWFYLGYFYQQANSLEKANEAYWKSAKYKTKVSNHASPAAKKDFLEKEIGLYYTILRNDYLLNNLEAAFHTSEIIRSRWLVEEVSKKNEIITIPNLAEVQANLSNDEAIISLTNIMDFYLFSIYIDSDTVLMIRKPFNNFYVDIQSDSIIHNFLRTNLDEKHSELYSRIGENNGRSNFEINPKLYRTLIDKFRHLMQNPLPGKSELSKLERFGAAFYDIHLKAFQDQLAEKEKLIIIPSGYMGYLPFEAFQKEGNYLVEDYTIRYSPSVSVWNYLQSVSYCTNRKSIIAFGDADYEIDKNAVYTDSQATVSEIKRDASTDTIKKVVANLNLPNLVASKDELNTINKVFKNPKLIRGRRVTESRVKKLSREGILKEYKILHFSTHGIFVPYRTDLSSLIFPGKNDKYEDGLLNIQEIANLHLNSDLTVLSACETGLGDAYSGDGITGISQAFLIAGSKSVSISLWAISDRSAADFTAYMYSLDSFKEGRYDEALTETKRYFISGAAKEIYEYPFFWAPYIMFGN